MIEENARLVEDGVLYRNGVRYERVGEPDVNDPNYYGLKKLQAKDTLTKGEKKLIGEFSREIDVRVDHLAKQALRMIGQGVEMLPMDLGLSRNLDLMKVRGVSKADIQAELRARLADQDVDVTLWKGGHGLLSGTETGLIEAHQQEHKDSVVS